MFWYPEGLVEGRYIVIYIRYRRYYIVYKHLFGDGRGGVWALPRRGPKGSKLSFISDMGIIIWYINTNFGVPWAGFWHPEGLAEWR